MLSVAETFFRNLHRSLSGVEAKRCTVTEGVEVNDKMRLEANEVKVSLQPKQKISKIPLHMEKPRYHRCPVDKAN